MFDQLSRSLWLCRPPHTSLGPTVNGTGRGGPHQKEAGETDPVRAPVAALPIITGKEEPDRIRASLQGGAAAPPPQSIDVMATPSARSLSAGSASQ